jgi:hypothetical protein
VMSALMWIGRTMGMPANLEMMLGTIVMGPGATARTLWCRLSRSELDRLCEAGTSDDVPASILVRFISSMRA